MEEKSDDGMSTATATMNKIDDDRLSQEPKRKESKAVRRVEFAYVIDQCGEGDAPALGQALIDEHFLKKGSHAEGVLPFGRFRTDQRPDQRIWFSSGGPGTGTVRRLCSVRGKGNEFVNG